MKKAALVIIILFFYSISFGRQQDSLAEPAAGSQIAIPANKIKTITLLNDTLKEAALGKKIKIQLDTTFTGSFEQPYILYINGVPMKSIKAISKNSSNKELIFKLYRTKDEDDILNTYYDLGNPFKRVQIGVGTEQGSITEAQDFTLVLYNPKILGVGILLIALLLFSFFFLNAKWPIIKDENSLPNKEKPYSLSRTQLAWWSIIILSSFIFLISITGELFTITGSSVILLGISAATFAAGKMIDNSDKAKLGERHQERPSEGFFIDLLSDENGVSIHRFQSIAFNIVIGLFFLWEVIHSLRMPEIDSSLLALMGISSGTYALLKTNENKNLPLTDPSAPALGREEDDNAKGSDTNSEILPVG